MEPTLDSLGISSPRSPVRIVLRLMDTYHQCVPQPNGVLELPSEHRLLHVANLINYFAKYDAACRSWLLVAEVRDGGTKMGGNVRVVFYGIGVVPSIMIM
jgi:hypothetical protein